MVTRRPNTYQVDSGEGVYAGVDAPSSGGATWHLALPLWQWYEIPNTALSSVAPSPLPTGGTGPSAKIDSWCGATLKRNGSVYLLGACGGHADYAGNEVNALYLDTDTPHWAQLKAPTPNAYVVNATQFYLQEPDGKYRPAATHTYYATQFIESTNRMVVLASPGLGGPWPSPPTGFPYAGEQGYNFSFSLDNNDWDAPEYMARWPGVGDFTACLCATNHATGEIYYSKSYPSEDTKGFWKYTPGTNAWTYIGGYSRNPWYAGAAIDYTRNRMLTVGGFSTTAPSVLSLANTDVPATFTGPNAADLTLSGGYPGVVYDEANDDYLVVFNQGSSIEVRRVDAATWYVDSPVSGTKPANRVASIVNSAQYVPHLKGVAIANKYSGNVWFLRTAI